MVRKARDGWSKRSTRTSRRTGEVSFLVEFHLPSARSKHHVSPRFYFANKTSYLYKKLRHHLQPPQRILDQQRHPQVPRHSQQPALPTPYLRDAELDPAPQVREALTRVLLGAVDLLELAVVQLAEAVAVHRLGLLLI